jgi:hypothetical protein
MPRRRTRSKRSRTALKKTRRRIQRGGAVNNINEWIAAAGQKRESLLRTDYIISQLKSSDLQFEEQAMDSSEALSTESKGDFGLELQGQVPKDFRRLMVGVKELLTNPTTGYQYEKGELVQFLRSRGNVDLRVRTPEFSDIHFLNDVEAALRGDPTFSILSILSPDINEQLPLFIEFAGANANPEDEKVEIPMPFQAADPSTLPALPV